MGTFLVVIGAFGFLAAIIAALVYAIQKKPRKNVGKVIGISLAMMFVGFIIVGVTEPSSTEPTLSAEEQEKEREKERMTINESDKELLKKAYADFDSGQRTQFAEIESKYEKLADAEKEEFKADFERLSQEQAVQLAELAEAKALFEETKAKAEAQKYDTGITFEQLARTPDEFNGDYIKFSGKVLQVIENGSETDLRIAIDGNYDNVMFVGYDPSITSERVLEDDMVTFKGESIGLYTYESTFGGNISIPGALAAEMQISN